MILRSLPLAGAAREFADRTAIIDARGSYRYAELDDASRRVASTLLGERNDLEEARVAFLIAPGLDYVAAQWGIWRAGGIAVPLATSHPPAELDYVIRDADASVLIADAAFAETLRPLAAAAGVSFTVIDELRAGESRDLPPIAPDRRALMLYTSGTTGKPKGVVITHANIAAQITALTSAWGWSADDRVLLVLPLHHVHGIVNVLGCALGAGAACEMHVRFDAEATWDRLASGELTLFMAVPTTYHRLIAAWDSSPVHVQRARSAGCRQLRLMVSGSAALPVKLLERWREISGHTLLERYGMTEIGMALSNPLHGERRPGFVGAPLPGVEVQLVDDEGDAVEPGSPGEIEVSGPSVFVEYWRRPDATRAAFRDGWFRTGDVAMVTDGYYRILGRSSVDIIKTGGYKVSALEIEEVLRTHEAIVECAVVGIADAEWGERVCVAIERRGDADLSIEALQTWARSQLAPYKLPRELRAVTALPRNAMGKVVKPDVAKLFL